MSNLTIGMLYVIGGCVMMGAAKYTTVPALTVMVGLVAIIVGGMHLYGVFDK